MRDDGDHRVLHRGQIPALERCGRLAGIVVERREDDIELLQDAVREIEPAVRKDVHFAAVQDLDIRVSFAEARDFIGLAGDTVQRQGARRHRARRVVRDGDVLVAELGAGADHLLDEVTAVAPRRVHVQIAADVGARDEPGQRAVARRRSSSSPFRISAGMKGRPSRA